MDQANSNTNSPALCRGNCGFYGSSNTENYCSKCFKDLLNRKMQQPNSMAPSSASSVSVTLNSSSSASSSPVGVGASSFLDLTGGSPVSLSSSVPVHSSAHMPKPSSSISLISGASSTSADSALSSSPSSASLPGSYSDPSLLTESMKKTANRCVECNKKVGLTGFECRCGGMYCSLHRYSDTHKCSFDYKQMGADEIRKNNPAVRGEKVQKL